MTAADRNSNEPVAPAQRDDQASSPASPGATSSGVAPASIPGDDSWLAEHGIAADVWKDRGVWRYEQDDPRVSEAFWPFLPAEKLLVVDKIVEQIGGLVLVKHAPYGFPPVPPQLRPDYPVIVDPRRTWHYHGDHIFDEDEEWPRFPPEFGSGECKDLPSTLVRTGYEAEEHIAKSHPDGNRNDVHSHDPDPAKYILLGNGKRVDLHPMAADLLEDAEVVYFVLEGALKNDAVLSAIIRTGESASVISVPSVTMWPVAELRQLKPRLRGKTILIIPDADGYKNDLVTQQALMVRSALRHLGLIAHVASPPYDDNDLVLKDGKWKPRLNGVDDFLGNLPNADGTPGDRTLADLELYGREVPGAVEYWQSWYRKDRDRRARRALEGLSLHADGDGRHNRSLGSLAYVMGVDRRKVVETLQDLSDCLVVQSRQPADVALATKVHTRRNVKVRDWWYMNPKVRPTVELHPEYRASEHERLRAPDYWARAAYDLASKTARRVDALERTQAGRFQLHMEGSQAALGNESPMRLVEETL